MIVISDCKQMDQKIRVTGIGSVGIGTAIPGDGTLVDIAQEFSRTRINKIWSYNISKFRSKFYRLLDSLLQEVVENLILGEELPIVMELLLMLNFRYFQVEQFQLVLMVVQVDLTQQMQDFLLAIAQQMQETSLELAESSNSRT